MSSWSDFADVIGAATASLLGLLFVAVSIRVETIAGSDELRNRSAQTMPLLPPAGAAIVLIAGQRDGLHLLVPTLVAVLVGGVTNAWLILVRLTT